MAGTPGPWSKVFYKQPGAIQVLGNKDEFWVFFQLDYYVRFANPLASPRCVRVAQEQYAIRYNGRGWSSPTKVGSLHGPTLRTNLTRVLRFDGRFLLITESAPASVYRWDGNAFVPLDDTEALTAKRAIGYADTTSVLANAQAIDAMTERAGWHVLYRETEPFPFWGDHDSDYGDPLQAKARFQWNNISFAIIGYNQLPNSSLQIIELGKNASSPHELITFDGTEHYLSSWGYRQLRK